MSDFSRTLALLRREKKISQRAAAGDLGVSQALLSHYENGLREPGLSFVVRAADYYGVSCDYLLGRSMARDGSAVPAERMEGTDTETEHSQIVQAVRSLKLTPAQLIAFLNDPKNSLTASGHTDPKPEAPEKEDTAHEKN